MSNVEILVVALSVMLATIWLWVPAMVFAALSPWWGRAEKTFIALSPLVSLLGVVLSLLALDVTGRIGLLLVVIWPVGQILLLITLARAASRRATAAGRTGVAR